MRLRLLTFWILVLVLIGTRGAIVEADSPPNLSDNVPWTDTGGVCDVRHGTCNGSLSGVVDIEAAFNNARRQEENQLGLAAGALGDLDLPSQTVWDNMDNNEKALFLINAERTARAGMQANVLGLPLTGTHPDLINIAQNYAQLLIDNNAFSHDADGKGPFTRIDEDPVIGQCHEFLSRAENLAVFLTSGSTIPLPVERSIYGWLYDDADSGWGHRETVLLQDKDLQGHPWGYTNNAGSPSDEGYLGIGRASGNNYRGWNFAEMVVMNIIDQVAGDCPFPNCPADLDGSGTVDVQDVEVAAANFRKDSSDPNWANNVEKSDMNMDFKVNVVDVMLIVTQFGSCA